MSVDTLQIQHNAEQHTDELTENTVDTILTETHRDESIRQYLMVCKKRIKEIKHLQDKQFDHEIKNLEAMQQSAYDQVRFHRAFAITTLWPPLHSRKEIENTMKRFYGKTQWHIRRINFIIENMKF